MARLENTTIHLNRGDELNIKMNSQVGFEIGDTFKFSIMKKNNCEEVLLQKQFIVENAGTSFEIQLTSEETRIGSPLKTGSVTYWYEIEYNGSNTILGCDKDGGKELILYPEAATKKTEETE